MACPSEKIFNVLGLFLGLLMAVAGVAMCATAKSIDDAQTFMIGIYLVGFGIFAVATEITYLPSITKYLLFFDGYFGKGFFYIFWGFLMWNGKVEWIILALVFLCSGICGRRRPPPGRRRSSRVSRAAFAGAAPQASSWAACRAWGRP